MPTRLLTAIVLACLLGASAFADAPGLATVYVRVTPDGALAHITLNRAVTSFTFRPDDVEREDFALQTPGLTISGDTISADRSFRAFDVLIRPMAHERDGKYPAYFQVGDGGVLYAPALIANEATWRTRFVYQTGRGQTHIPTEEVTQGSVYIGPRAYVSETARGIFISAPDTPAWIVARARDEAGATLDFYTERLGVALPTRPVFILAYMGNDSASMVADVTPGPVVAYRLHGASWLTENASDAERFDAITPHEAFHFWNGALVHNAETAPSWLHEGGADYAALLARLHSGALDEDGMRQRLGQALTQCREALGRRGDVGMGALEFLPWDVRYPCGIIIQWAGDLDMRARGQDVLDAWRAMIAAARGRPTQQFDTDDFYHAIGAAGAPPVVGLLNDASGAARWPTLVSALETRGARITIAPNADTRRQAMLFHLLRQSCPRGVSIGYSINGQTLQLDAAEQCGALAGSPVLTHVEGFDALDASAEAYAAVQARCATSAAVRVTFGDGREAMAPCRAPLEDAPNAYHVEAWR